MKSSLSPDLWRVQEEEPGKRAQLAQVSQPGELSSVWLDHKGGHWGELEAQKTGAVTWGQVRGQARGTWAEWRSSWWVSLEFLASFMLWTPASESFFAVQQMVMGKVLGDIWSSEWLSAYQVKSYLVREYPYLKSHHEETGVDFLGWGIEIELRAKWLDMQMSAFKFKGHLNNQRNYQFIRLCLSSLSHNKPESKISPVSETTKCPWSSCGEYRSI